MNQPAESLGRRMAKGAVWMVVLRLTVKGLGLISTMILFRILVPEDFGLIALGWIVVGFVEMLGEFGFDYALIQKQKADRRHYDTVWTLMIVRGVTTTILLLIFAGAIATFFNEPRLELIIMVLALAPLFEGFQNVGVVDFRKNLEFSYEFKFEATKKVITFLVTIGLAIVYESYWALIAGIVVGRGVGLVLSYVLHPYRPRLSISCWREMFDFSKWLLLNNIVLYSANQVDKILINKYLGIHLVGIYKVAQDIADLVTTELVWPIERALYPGFSKISDNLPELRSKWLDSLGMVTLIGLPASVGMAMVADPFVRVVLGEKGIEAIPIIQILAFVGTMRIFASSVGSIYLALNKPHIAPRVTIVMSFFRIAFLSYGVVYYGVMGAAYALLLTSIISLFLNMSIVWRLLQFRVVNVFTVSIRSILSVSIMAMVILFFEKWWVQLFQYKYTLIQLPMEIVVGGFVYTLSILIAWTLSGKPVGAEKHIVDEIFYRYKSFIKAA